LDLIVAMMIFLVIVLMFMWAWGDANSNVWGYENSKTHREKAMNVLDVLLRTSGGPSNWEDLQNVTGGNVTSIGLVSEPSVLDRAKLRRLSDIPYDEARRIMGFGSEGYGIEVMNDHGSILYSFGEDHVPLVSIERFAMLGNDTVTFTLSIFQK